MMWKYATTGGFRSGATRRDHCRWLLTMVLCLGMTAGLGRAGEPKPKTAKPDKPIPGEALFRTNGVLRMSIQLDKAALESLRREPRKYVAGTVTEGADTYPQVAIHLKGAAGSFRNVDDKPALTLHFGKYVPDGRFYGLRKIHLNNSVQDPTYMAEHLCTTLFLEAGVPATRVAHALVELNGRKLGLYVLKEGFEKEFLGLHFKKTSGNLYDGGFLKDITDPLEKDRGDGPDDHSDLKALVKAAEERDREKRWERLSQLLDVKRFASYMVIENMTWDWDGYVMNRNNYRVYFDVDSNRLVFLPHGLDQMFWEPEGPLLSNANGMLARAFMGTAGGRRLYRRQYSELFTNVFKVEVLTNRIDELEARLKPALESWRKDAGRVFENRARELRRKIVGRAASIARQLQAPPAKALKFVDGVTHPENWWQSNEDGSAALQDSRDEDGRETLSIRAGRETGSSWRSRITLLSGRYRFEALTRCAGVKGIRDEKGLGAGLRLSDIDETRRNQLEGDSDWQKLEYGFEVLAPFEELELVCELRATAGQVWFDKQSLRLVRIE